MENQSKYIMIERNKFAALVKAPDLHAGGDLRASPDDP